MIIIEEIKTISTPSRIIRPGRQSFLILFEPFIRVVMNSVIIFNPLR